ncbi:alpha/beta-hydrolase [Lentinus tigrinus ALCF2SS1-7]|uniref:Carboxypeptidase n=1 Tax=Lentinus tigrinus ALCF2SS1-6 TaxID=1328759 RepID=A0A5C2SA81_9APHY|nr:alpha/beta-hydrolase [Lentinus tigrinus ALCF2SS1-6]RPD75833.1 alpha/beta-hydrolase [Lentinus tigrinus ALCF2SS1-7]
MEIFFVLSQLFLSVFRAAAPPDVSVSEGALLDIGTPYIKFKSNIIADTQVRYVRNSGVCETTPGVNQWSGYLDIGTNMSMWFWFFEARNESDTAPFTLWLNGGPGCSSMIGLFQENGPCQVNPDNQTTVINPYSWNSKSNMIYVDQPIGSGFSYGTVDVNSTFASAPPVWTFFQLLFENEEFEKFKSREFILATESYGGHYGPEFVAFFEEQNTKIMNGTLEGQVMNITALMINNGWHDPLIQFESYLEFATDAPGYGQLQSDEILAAINESLYKEGGCRDQLIACYRAETEESNKICYDADDFCLMNVQGPSIGDLDQYDFLQKASSPNPFPPMYYVNFLQNTTIMQKIGAQVRYSDCSDPVLGQFNSTGDDARTLLPQLGALADSGLKILIWAGETDINCNWVGVHESVLAMDWYGNQTLTRTPFTNMTIDGETVAAYQNVDNFTFARVYGAGHEVPAFKPEASLEIFSQIIHMEPLHSVP